MLTTGIFLLIKIWNIVIKFNIKYIKIYHKIVNTLKKIILKPPEDAHENNDEFFNNVTASISLQITLRMMAYRDQHNHKRKTKKINEKGHIVTAVVEDPIVKKS